MILFLLSYLCIYGLMHFYAFCKMKEAVHLGFAASCFLWTVFALLIAAPIAIRVAERQGVTTGLHLSALTAFGWMGLLFLFVSISAAVDLAHLLSLLMEKYFSSPFPLFSWSETRLLSCTVILTVSLFVYGLFEAGSPRLEHVVLFSPKIPADAPRIRIAQISDVHLGLLVGKRKLRHILERIKEAQPDLLVSTGDLVDGQPNDLHEEAGMLAALEPPLGKVAVTGNHEFYAGLDNAVAFTRASGFTLLRQQVKNFTHFTVAGVDDKAAAFFRRQPQLHEEQLLTALPKDRFVLLLKHRPDVNAASRDLFDLQLSGHTHKGQIFPFNLVTRMFYPYPSAVLTRLGRGYLYLNRGTATWGPPVRIFAPPEITIIDLEHGP